ncbi:hypothetical protein [Acetobacter cibinongensis]|uniref:Uncharacterized protein n=1 Tax=Acetobacter cibinongensis TaxID=146475 RepID=A0A1Z5YR19_9PROT|nr:hypothetical protein [Acetobacter cibinongensis]OUI97766.1 hypothetical protein HK14_01870 [Acetobacter cibinongensis]
MNSVYKCILENLSDDNFYGIWNDLFRDNEKLKTHEKIEKFFEFFIYGMRKNILLEYDLENKSPIFSRDDPYIVVHRIFSDLKNLNLPENNGDVTREFIAYAMTKYGWAVLRDGTFLFLPD